MVFLQYSMVRYSMKQNRVVVSTHGDHPKSVEISVVENTYMPYTAHPYARCTYTTDQNGYYMYVPYLM